MTYKGKTATFEVEVIKKEATKIELVTLPNKIEYIRGQKLDSDGAIKTEYIEGQPLDISNLKVIALYNDGTSEVIDASMDMISGYDVNIIGKQTITVTYKGKTTTFEVNVKAKSVTKIEVTPPNKLEYIEGQRLDLSGGKVKVFYDNGTSEEISLTDDMISGYDTSLVGKQTITVTYKGETTTFDVNVIEKVITKIEMNSLPNKVNYLVDQKFEINGATIKVYYNDGSEEIVNVDSNMFNLPNMSKIGNQTIIVNYGGLTTSFEILINDKTLVNITISTLPDKTEYIEGQGLDVTGGKLLLTYDNGSSEIIDITLAMCSVDMSKPGQINVSVTYNGFTVTYLILIKEKTPVSLI